jgi:hypothetical protein
VRIAFERLVGLSEDEHCGCGEGNAADRQTWRGTALLMTFRSYFAWARESPQVSKDSHNAARFSGAKTGTVFGTVRLFDLEP